MEAISGLLLCFLDVWVFITFADYFLLRRESLKKWMRITLIIIQGLILYYLVSSITSLSMYFFPLCIFSTVIIFSVLYSFNIPLLFLVCLLYSLFAVISTITYDLVNDVLGTVVVGLFLRGIICLFLYGVSKIRPKQMPMNHKLSYFLAVLTIFHAIIILAVYYSSVLITTDDYNYVFVLGLFFILISILIVSGLFLYVLKVMDEKADLTLKNNMMMMGQVNVDMMNQNNQELRRMKHDLNHMFTSLKYLLDSQQYEEAVKLLDEAKEAKDHIKKVVQSGNFIVDSVLNSYMSQYPDIEFDTQIALNDDIYIEEVDLCLLLGNIISNAAEAAQHVDGHKKITVIMKVIHNNFVISVVNPFNKQYSFTNFETSKQAKKEHGYGHKSMQLIVEKYDGVLDEQFEDDIFTLKILFSL